MLGSSVSGVVLPACTSFCAGCRTWLPSCLVLVAALLHPFQPLPPPRGTWHQKCSDDISEDDEGHADVVLVGDTGPHHHKHIERIVNDTELTQRGGRDFHRGEMALYTRRSADPEHQTNLTPHTPQHTLVDLTFFQATPSVRLPPRFWACVIPLLQITFYVAVALG